MTLPSGAQLAQGEYQRIADAVAKLEKDHHAPRQISVALNLHFHHEFPRAIYKGQKSIVVNNEAELAEALHKGYSLEAPVPPSEDEAA